MTNREHDRVYAVPALPAFTFHELDDRLLAGRAPLTKVDVGMLADVGVTRILGLREEHDDLAPELLGVWGS